VKPNTKLFLLAGLLIVVALAVVVSPFASDEPDGLEKVAAEEGFDDAADEHDFADGPFSDLSAGAAGLVGVLLTFGAGIGVFAVLRALRPKTPADRQDA
jgi:cobalt/nickel transport system permease protein